MWSLMVVTLAAACLFAIASIIIGLRQSSSASRFTAGASGFLNFSQSGDRPEALRHDAFQPHLAGVVEHGRFLEDTVELEDSIKSRVSSRAVLTCLDKLMSCDVADVHR